VSGQDRRPLQQENAWQAGQGALYMTNLLPEHAFQGILAEFGALQRKGRLQEEGPCMAEGRLAAPAPPEGVAARALLSDIVLERLQASAGLPCRPRPLLSFPPEYRLYTQGSFVTCHRDEALTDPPQLELVYTVENTSDSVTTWAKDHLEFLREDTFAVWTAPNSGLLMQARGAVHSVSELTCGHRAIVKVALVTVPIDEEIRHTESWARNADMVHRLAKNDEVVL